MAQYKSKFVFGLCLATRTHIWHFYDALLYIVQFSGNVFVALALLLNSTAFIY
ncbi:hypothetical protein SAMN04488500_1172 [Sporomusa malonica]|uniref:Uncharacterized protein n=1 Tax=Sporomusa malonica TaxID=112901 RepID=A0A1W2DNZ2_9FIRM|nr:hypothetical protein SAMN04488500_1172 [Sporomusa malonica]